MRECAPLRSGPASSSFVEVLVVSHVDEASLMFDPCGALVAAIEGREAYVESDISFSGADPELGLAERSRADLRGARSRTEERSLGDDGRESGGDALDDSPRRLCPASGDLGRTMTGKTERAPNVG